MNLVKAVLVLGLLVSGCVTTHYGRESNVAEGKLHVSCSNLQWITDQFASVSCSFENMTNEWVNVEVESVKIIRSKETIVPLSPSQTMAFAKAYQFEKDKNDSNTGLALSAVMVGGLVVAGASGNSHVATAGAGAALGAAGYTVGKKIAEDIHNIQYARYSEDHILGGETSIPAKLFVRKAAVFQISDPSVAFEASAPAARQARLEICFKTPKVECISPQDSVAKERKRGGY